MGVRASFGPPAPAVPGEVARCDLTVENTGPDPEDVRVELAGDAAAWAWASPAALTVAPGEVQTVLVTVKLPRTSTPASGPLALEATVVPARNPADAVTAATTLHVAPFVAAVASLRPPATSGRTGRHRLTVENRGNTALAATVEARGDGVTVDVEPALLRADPGQAAEADVTVRASRRGLRSGAATRPFSVVVRTDGHAELARTDGVLAVGATGWAGRVGVVLVVLALVGIALRATIGSGGGTGPSTSEVAAPGTAPSDCPGRDHLSPDANGIVRPGIKPLFDYSFLFVGADGCQPARFNPCAPVQYVLNRTLATDADVADLTEAIRKVADATGLEFQYAGTSTEDPRSTARPVRAPDGTITWPPVLIGWAHLGTGDALRPSTTAGGGSGTGAGGGPPANQGVVGGGGRPQVSGNVITTGNLVLNLDAVTDTDTHNPVPHGFGSGVNWGRIMMHELAHVVGLGHVESRTSIMNETLTQQTIPSTEFGVGDLIGLRYLGKQGGCLPVPPLQTPGLPRS
jgi:hypothetical protein